MTPSLGKGPQPKMRQGDSGINAANILPLARDGLIAIEWAATDRRAKELHLTKAGEKRLQAGIKAWAQAQARFETKFGSKRAAELRAMLRAVVATEFAPATHDPAQFAQR